MSPDRHWGPLYKEGALPPWCQLTGTLWRSSHHEDEITFVIRVNSHRSGRWGHLLVYEGGWLRRNCWPGPLKTPREVSSGRQWWFRCRHRDGEAFSRDFGWLNMVYVDCPPHHVILICHLIGIGDPLYKEGALPPWCQLTGTLWRSSHHEDEITFVIRVNSHRSGRWGHLLVYEGEALLHYAHIGCGVL